MDSSAQIKVNFTTPDADLQLPESKRQLLVPADIKRYGLSKILNSESMLNTTAPVPLDFLINGAFLQTSLDEYLQTNGHSLEATVTLQYVRSLLPPVYEASFNHDDWISSVDVLSATSPAGGWSGDAFIRGQDRVLSTGYDGLVRIWNAAGDVLAVSPAASQGGHSRRLNAARFLSANQLVSAGLDQKIIVWDYSSAPGSESGVLKPTVELVGHGMMVNAIEVNGATKRIITGSSDGRVGVWTAIKGKAPPADPSSLPATYSNKPAVLAPNQRGPIALFPAGDQRINGVAFHPADQTVAYSVSADHALRTLDLATIKTVSTITTLHDLLCVCPLPARQLVAVGTAARHASLIDPRDSAAQVSALTLRGHANMVAALAACPDNDHTLLSGSHDGSCRVWDLRSVRPARPAEGDGSVCEPVYVIKREWITGKLPVAGQGAKVLCCAWDKTWGIVSGGEDKHVQINRGRDLLS